MGKITIQNLNYKIKNVPILNNINLDFASNSYTTVIGPIGCGKTTLFKLIIKGNENIKINGNIKYIVTDPNKQIMAKTVKEQLKFFLETEGYKKRQITTRVNNIIKKFSLNNILDKDPYLLSEGEKQLVVFCSILVLDLDILIIDNALCRLDLNTKQQVIKYLLKLKNKKTTIINFTSDIREIENCDYIVLMNKTIIFNKKAKETLSLEKEFLNNGLKLPFMWELSLKLKYYQLIDKEEFDMQRMVDKLWN